MEYREIIYEVKEGVATITLNRPRSLNALTHELSQEWVQALKEARRNDEVKVVVVTGAGRAFCAGANVRALGEQQERLGKEARQGRLPLGSEMVEAVLGLAKPYLGAINGPCVGGGMNMALLCDIRIASDQARFGMTQVRMGVVPGGVGCYLLPRLIGLPQALELAWIGRIIDAQEALRLGLVNRVVPHEELMAATWELAQQLARGPTVAIRLIKHLMYECPQMDLMRAAEVGEMAMLLACETEDAQEGPRAWVEKREPRFKGR